MTRYGLFAVMASTLLGGTRVVPLFRGGTVTHGAAAVLAAQADTAQVRFAITGMTCGSCAVTARFALQRLDGVYSAEVSYDSASAMVRYDPQRVTPAQIAAHLERLTGYRATVVTPPASEPRREP